MLKVAAVILLALILAELCLMERRLVVRTCPVPVQQNTWRSV